MSDGDAAEWEGPMSDGDVAGSGGLMMEMLLPHWGLLHSLHLPKAPTRKDRSDARPVYNIYIYTQLHVCIDQK